MKKRYTNLIMVGMLVAGVVLSTPKIGFASENEGQESGTWENQIEVLESEKAELEEKVRQLEADNEKLRKEIQEKESETEAQTEIVGVTYSDKSIVQIVQAALNKEGFDCGTPDGVAGSKTTEAIKAYEQKAGINVNGVITDELLEALNVSDEVDEAAKAEASKAEYSSDYSYEQLARNPDTYIGEKMKFSGKVLQAQTGDINYIRLAVNSDYNTVIFVTYDADIIDYRLLEDDYITIYGTSYSTYSYEAVSGATITLPWVWADIIELQ